MDSLDECIFPNILKKSMEIKALEQLHNQRFEMNMNHHLSDRFPLTFSCYIVTNYFTKSLLYSFL